MQLVFHTIGIYFKLLNQDPMQFMHVFVYFIMYFTHTYIYMYHDFFIEQYRLKI